MKSANATSVQCRPQKTLGLKNPSVQNYHYADLLNSSSDVFRDVHEAGALFRIQVGEKLGQDASVHLHQGVQVHRDEVAGSGNRVDGSNAAEKVLSFSHILSQTQSRTLSLSDFLFHRFLLLYVLSLYLKLHFLSIYLFMFPNIEVF